MIRPVSSSKVLAADELIAQYAAECSISAIGDVNPQGLTYAALEQSGMMRCFGAFEDEEMVGFAFVLTPVLPHYGKRVATIESLFIARAHRAILARPLMRAVEEYAASISCVGILYSAPAGGQLERLLEASKPYQRTNAVFYRSFN